MPSDSHNPYPLVYILLRVSIVITGSGTTGILGIAAPSLHTVIVEFSRHSAKVPTVYVLVVVACPKRFGECHQAVIIHKCYCPLAYQSPWSLSVIVQVLCGELVPPNVDTGIV